jgi:hypothetical protein
MRSDARHDCSLEARGHEVTKDEAAAWFLRGAVTTQGVAERDADSA